MKLLSGKETAARLGVSYWTLVNWRRPDYRGPGRRLRHVKIGHFVKYRETDVARFVARCAAPTGAAA